MAATTASRRVWGIDALKAIGIACVVALHTGLFSSDFIAEPTASEYVRYALRLLSEGVPLFLLVNGYLLFRKPGLDLKKHLKKTFKILVLLVAWAAIHIVCAFAVSGEELSLARVAKEVLDTSMGSSYTGVLWYLQTLFGLYLLFPIAKRAYDADGKTFAVLYAVLAALACAYWLSDTLSCAAHPFSYLTSWVRELIPVGSASNVLFFMGGALLVRYEQRLAEKRRALVALGLAAWVASVAYGIVISKLSGQTALTGMNAQFLFEPAILLGWWAALGHVAAGRLPAPLGKAVSNLGASTLGVYLAHYLFIRLYLFAGFSVDGVAHEIFFYIVVLCLSWLVANIGERVKGLRYLFTL